MDSSEKLGPGAAVTKWIQGKLHRPTHPTNSQSLVDTTSPERSPSSGAFTINVAEDGRAKAEVINPEALKVYWPKRFIERRLVRKDEAVVSFTGQPEQLINFIRQAQQQPLVALETGNQPQNLPGYNISLQRTGIYLIVPDPHAEKSDNVERLQPQNAGNSTRLLVEVVGIQETENSYAVAVLYPHVSAIQVLDLGDIGRVTRTIKGKAEDSPNYRYLKRLEAHHKEGILSTLDVMWLSPFTGDKVAPAIREGAIIEDIRYEDPSSGKWQEILQIQSRRPSPTQSLSESIDHKYVRIETVPKEQLSNFFDKVVVPAKIATSH